VTGVVIGKLSPCLSDTIIKIRHLKDNGVTTLFFWGHMTSSDHSSRGGRLPMCGPSWPCIYLAQLWRYSHL